METFNEIFWTAIATVMVLSIIVILILVSLICIAGTAKVIFRALHKGVK